MTPLKLAEGLFEEIRAVIGKYSGTMPVATAIGVVELVKDQLIRDHNDEEDDDE